MHCCIPVVHNKEYDLSDSNEEVCQVSNSIVLIVHSREVHHIQSLHTPVQVVQEWHCGATLLSGTNWNLVSQWKSFSA